MPVRLGTGGGPACTPRVIRASTGRVTAAGAADARAAVASVAPPRTAATEAVIAERREMPSHPSAHPGMAATYHPWGGVAGSPLGLVAEAGEETPHAGGQRPRNVVGIHQLVLGQRAGLVRDRLGG